MKPKKYNYDEPIETNIASEPTVAYGYANQGTHGCIPELTKPVREQRILEPDDDFYRAISMEEFRERMHVSIRKFFADKRLEKQ
ncbi:MAG: hypothetical protein LBH22_05035 [Bacteroidales bacterium]|jgi:hypothetical protein|nr:hypothetical protein [Bacteroidales bacterium]